MSLVNFQLKIQYNEFKKDINENIRVTILKSWQKGVLSI